MARDITTGFYRFQWWTSPPSSGTASWWRCGPHPPIIHNFWPWPVTSNTHRCYITISLYGKHHKSSFSSLSVPSSPHILKFIPCAHSYSFFLSITFLFLLPLHHSSPLLSVITQYMISGFSHPPPYSLNLSHPTIFPPSLWWVLTRALSRVSWIITLIIPLLSPSLSLS